MLIQSAIAINPGQVPDSRASQALMTSLYYKRATLKRDLHREFYTLLKSFYICPGPSQNWADPTAPGPGTALEIAIVFLEIALVFPKIAIVMAILFLKIHIVALKS
jgi:hypothetical protein